MRRRSPSRARRTSPGRSRPSASRAAPRTAGRSRGSGRISMASMRDFAASIPCSPASFTISAAICLPSNDRRPRRSAGRLFRLNCERNFSRSSAGASSDGSSSKNASNSSFMTRARSIVWMSPSLLPHAVQPDSTCCFTCAFSSVEPSVTSSKSCQCSGQATAVGFALTRAPSASCRGSPRSASTRSSASSPSPSSSRRGCTPGRSRAARCACTAGRRCGSPC